MGEFREFAFYALIIGIGATMVMDVWGLLAARLFNFPPPNYALVGRWIGHMPQGRFVHAAIAQSPPVTGERHIGWLVHYAIGTLFAALLLVLYGVNWAHDPVLLPALFIGFATLAAPFFLMQPGMGLGFAASRATHPPLARFRSILTHGVFGFGLYGAALVVRMLLP